MVSAADFLSWIMEDTETICAEIGSPRDERLRQFEVWGFVRFKGAYHGTNDYEITSKWASAIPSPHHSPTTKGD